jgi:hypothetical protein
MAEHLYIEQKLWVICLKINNEYGQEKVHQYYGQIGQLS